MKIRIEEIRQKPRVLTAVEPAESYPPLVEMQEAGDCFFLSPLTVTLDVAWEYGHVRVQGNIVSRIRLNCSRCLAEIERPLESTFTVFYTKAVPDLPADDEVELGESDLISTSYEGDEIDFAPEIAEQVMLEVPLKPLCREECLGLCSKCGQDLNVSECGCDRRSPTLKFSALKDFKVEK